MADIHGSCLLGTTVEPRTLMAEKSDVKLALCTALEQCPPQSSKSNSLVVKTLYRRNSCMYVCTLLPVTSGN